MIDKIKSFLKKYWILLLTACFIFTGVLLRDSVIVIIGCNIVIIDTIRIVRNQIFRFIIEIINEEEE